MDGSTGASPVVDEEQEVHCYVHTDTPTKLRCSRCDRPICGRCATPASVGQHCPECVGDARRSAPKVRGTLQATAPGVYAIIAICVIVFVGQVLSDEVTERFLSSGILIHDGEWWRLLTSIFLHAAGGSFFLLHIMFNMYILYMYGPQVEQAFGTGRFLLLFLATGFTGSAASYFMNGCVRGLGASGAIFGIVGVLLVFLYNRRASMFVQQYLNSLLVFIGINLVIGFTLAGIDNYAHLGGLAGGVALGFGFDNGAKPASRTRQLLVTAVVVGAGLAAVIYRTTNFSCGSPF